MNGLLTIFLTLCHKFEFITGSTGDQLPTYRRCIYSCIEKLCDFDGYSYLNVDEGFSLTSFIRWPCFDECKYNCMWETVEKLEEEGAPILQFNGKWPFLRIFGIQEPASMIFSLLNLVLHLKWLKIFRREVPSNCPLYWLWHVFAFVCMNAWIWSVLFHTKDSPLTEFMDYAGAFSIILINCYLMVVRLCLRLGRLYCMLISLFFILLFINHSLYLYVTNRIDYKYNMTLNFSIATFTAVMWLIWCRWNRKSQPYVRKCAIFVILTCCVAALEIIDRPPFLNVFDSHSMWHLSTAFLIGIFYRFGISDCLHLKRQELKETSFKNFKKSL